MPALPLVLLLAAAAPGGAAAPPAPATAPVPVTAPAPAQTTVAPPTLIGADAPAPAGAAAPVPVSPAGAAPTTASPPPPLPQAAVEKLGQGDRAFLERDYRSALFAYQDAVYLAPKSPVARVKLGRAYLALRYPAQALAQAEQALAFDPSSAEARKLAEEAKDPSRLAPRPAPAPAATQAVAPPSAAPAAATAARVFRFVPEPEPGAPAAPPPSAAAGRTPAVAEAARGDAAAAEPARAAAAAPAVAAVPQGATAGQRYRTALEHLQNREFEKAIAALTEAIALDPRLAVAYAARASARFGLGKYREAAEDYRAALAFDPNLGTPVYGLAECYRVQGESRNAAEMYQRYAESRAPDVREDLRAIAARRAQELR